MRCTIEQLSGDGERPTDYGVTSTVASSLWSRYDTIGIVDGKMEKRKKMIK